jgi:hypothetical protein
MMIDWTAAIPFDMILIYAVFSVFGAIGRALLGIYKGYTEIPMFEIDKKRIAVEVIASVFFGTFGAYILSRLNLFPFPFDVVALLAGFFGADIISLATKKLGLTGGLHIVVSEQQVAMAEFNDRQIACLMYLKNHDRMTNRMYQRLNNTTINVAKDDLTQLVRKKRLKRFGRGKATYYRPA